jgi:hypothetical protein
MSRHATDLPIMSDDPDSPEHPVPEQPGVIGCHGAQFQSMILPSLSLSQSSEEIVGV